MAGLYDGFPGLDTGTGLYINSGVWSGATGLTTGSGAAPVGGSKITLENGTGFLLQENGSYILQQT